MAGIRTDSGDETAGSRMACVGGLRGNIPSGLRGSGSAGESEGECLMAGESDGRDGVVMLL